MPSVNAAEAKAPAGRNSIKKFLFPPMKPKYQILQNPNCSKFYLFCYTWTETLKCVYMILQLYSSNISSSRKSLSVSKDAPASAVRTQTLKIALGLGPDIEIIATWVPLNLYNAWHTSLVSDSRISSQVLSDSHQLCYHKENMGWWNL